MNLRTTIPAALGERTAQVRKIMRKMYLKSRMRMNVSTALLEIKMR